MKEPKLTDESALEMMAAALVLGDITSLSPRKPKDPQNKHNLTEEERVKMRLMTPKQKKKFLRERIAIV